MHRSAFPRCSRGLGSREEGEGFAKSSAVKAALSLWLDLSQEQGLLGMQLQH